MTFQIKNHILFQDGKKVAQVPSPNHGGPLKASLLVMHYTGSRSTSGAIKTLSDGKAENRVSAHLVISPEGVVTQLVPFNVVAWHAGQSSWHGHPACNGFSIGIEMVNCGQLAKLANGTFVDRLNNRSVPSDQVVMACHKNGSGELPWQIYPPAQIAAATAVAAAIVKTYGIKDIAGHDDIAPKRKTDPGPAWPMGPFQSRVFGRA